MGEVMNKVLKNISFKDSCVELDIWEKENNKYIHDDTIYYMNATDSYLTRKSYKVKKHIINLNKLHFNYSENKIFILTKNKFGNLILDYYRVNNKSILDSFYVRVLDSFDK